MGTWQVLSGHATGTTVHEATAGENARGTNIDVDTSTIHCFWYLERAKDKALGRLERSCRMGTALITGVVAVYLHIDDAAFLAG